MALEITSENFNEMVLGNDNLVLVDFWAPWCGPCKMLGPVIEELAEEFKGQMIIGKINVDENPDLASQYSVMTIPTLIFFKNRVAIKRSVGAMGKEALLEVINSVK